MSAARHKLVEGQRGLFEGIPEVRYCQACGLLLRNERSQARGYGPTCYRRLQQATVSETAVKSHTEQLRHD